jgi:hypothetical protein
MVGGQECRRAGIQKDRHMKRQTDVQICIKTEIKTYRHKHTNIQTDRQKRQTQNDKLTTNMQIDRQYMCAVQKGSG